MNRPLCFAVILCFLPLFTLYGARANSEPASTAPRPNVVLVLVDDMGFSDLGCYGGEIKTPHLDRLAAGGLRFGQFYNTAKCAQTRATLLSGRYFPEVGTARLAECITLAEGLRLGGYKTYMSGKWHLSGNPVDRGFDRYFGHLSGSTNYFTGNNTFRIGKKPFEVPRTGFYTTDAMTDYAIRFLEESAESHVPFFLYLAYNAPHFPLQAPEKDVRKYLGTYRKGWDILRKERYQRMIKMGIIKKNWVLSPRPADVPAWDTLTDEEKEEHDLTMATFAGMIDRIDQNIGRLTAKLKEMGVFDNTVFLFLSDNGACPFQRTRKQTREKGLMPWEPNAYWTYDKGWAHACNTPFRLYKRNQHEGGIATPLIVHWPAGIKQPGSITHQAGHLVDIMATCLALAGVDYPASYQGRTVGPLRGKSLVPVFRGEHRSPHKELFFIFGPSTHRALRMGDWKIVSHDRGPWELYNMTADRTELFDLAAKDKDRREAMVKRWEELNAETARVKRPGPNRKKRRKR